MDKIDYYNVIRYSRLNGGDLDAIDCMMIHNHINNKSILKASLKAKITKIHNTIKDKEVPIYKYDDDREIVIYNDKERKFLKPNHEK